jgi:hypothetical protein
MAISPYMGNYTKGKPVKVLLCPSNPWPYYSINAQADPGTNYGMNSETFPSNWADQSGVDATIDPTHFIKNIRDTSLKAPSGVLFFGEIPMSNGNNPWGCVMSTQVTAHDPFTVAGNYAALHSTGLANAEWWDEQTACRVSTGNPCAAVFHFLSWNALMADGHVQLDSKASLLVVTASTNLSNRYWYNK